MKTPLGTRTQGLEKVLIENMKLTELVENPHVYHGELKNPREPLSITYKVAGIYREAEKSHDPFMDIIPIIEILERDYPGVIQIETNYDEHTQIYTLRLSIEHSLISDALEFKYRVLLQINEKISEYLTKHGKKPAKAEVSFRHGLAKLRREVGKDKNGKPSKKKKK